MPDSKIETLTEGVVNGTMHVSRLVASGTWTKPFSTGRFIGMQPSGRPTRFACACFLEVRNGKYLGGRSTWPYSPKATGFRLTAW